MLRDKIKEMAAEKGLTLRKVSEESGVPYSALACWNDSMPSAVALARVAKVLGTTSEELLEED